MRIATHRKSSIHFFVFSILLHQSLFDFFLFNRRTFTETALNQFYEVNFEPVSITIQDAWWQHIHDNDCDGIPCYKYLLMDLSVSAPGPFTIHAIVGDGAMVGDRTVAAVSQDYKQGIPNIPRAL